MTELATDFSNVTPLRKKEGNPRVLPVKAFDGALTGALTAKTDRFDGALTGLDGTLIAAINQHLEKYKTADNDSIQGAKLIAAHIEPGQEVGITDTLNQIAHISGGHSYRQLTDKCKPLLIDAGILVKINATKMRWANLKELQAIVDTCNEPALEPQQPALELQRTPGHLQRILSRLHPQNALNAWTMYRAKHSAWMDVNPDGSIQKHRKPFSGELTPAEKKAKREQAERAAYAKLLVSNQPVSKAAAELAEQKQLEAIERRAQQQAQMDTFWMWVKILGFAALVWFAIFSMGKGTVTSDQYLPQGIQGSYSE